MRDIRDMEAFAKSQNVIEEIYAERRRQVDSKGWTPEHDDDHDAGDLACAAACYATGNNRLAVSGPFGGPDGTGLRHIWPWAAEWWKPKDRRRDLVRAGALIVAEIERMDRAGSAKDPA